MSWLTDDDFEPVEREITREEFDRAAAVEIERWSKALDLMARWDDDAEEDDPVKVCEQLREVRHQVAARRKAEKVADKSAELNRRLA